MKKTKKLILATIVFLLAAALGGGLFFYLRFGKGEVAEEKQELHLVILDSGEYYYYDTGIQNGIEMALKQIKQDGGVPITVELVDDEGDYVRGMSLAAALAKDDSVDVVLSLQNFDSIGPEVEFFEEAKKPFLVTAGCYDEVAEQGYEYFFADFLSGKSIGERIGQYLIKYRAKNIALCHSDTAFEKSELQGLQSALLKQEESSLCYSEAGPFEQEEMSDFLQQCRKLSVDTVVMNFYHSEDSVNALTQIKKQIPDMVLFGDYALDQTEILKKHGKEMEGLMIVPAYPYQQSAKLDRFIKKYEKETKETFSTSAIQHYDLICMLSKCCEDGVITGEQLMQKLRSEEGHEGISGKILFDEKGCLQTEYCPVFVCRNKEFVILEKK